MHSIKTLGLRLLNAVIHAVGFVSFAGIVAMGGAAVMNHLTNSRSFGLANIVAVPFNRVEQPALDFLHSHVPCEFAGHDAAPVFIGLALLLLCLGCDWLASRVRVYRLSLTERQSVLEKQEAARARGAALNDPSKREELIEIYSKTKKILDDQKKPLAFLAIDVVDSTGMKHGEDPVVAEHNFRQYRKLVEGLIAEHKGLKSAWTPDGVMICFTAIDDAVRAGQGLIRSLGRFNLETKTIKAGFKVRCGINAGKVLFDDSVRLEEMSDSVIDLAGHMQKHAEPDAIFLGRNIIESIPAEFGFRPANKQVDGLDAFEWRAGA
ncbi:MAG: adenylate/guanylate cyclase domain-containing protein [Elusimicrobiota bacterium]